MDKHLTLTIAPEGTAIPAQAGMPLSAALQAAGIAFALPCGGRQVCGKCVLWARGDVLPPGAAEAGFLAGLAAAAAPAPGAIRRLACFCIPQGDCTLWLPGAQSKIQVEGAGEMPRYDGESPDALGIAIDIGTTTVAAALYHLPSGALLATESALNQQRTYGADVLSRIAYADSHGHSVLHDAIRTQLEGMIQGLLSGADYPAQRLSRIVLTGNTTMLHLVHGLDPHSIGQYPFTPESLFGTERPASALFPALPEGVTIYTPRCISAYVGADVTCGILSGGLTKGNGSRLLVDIGTNGEMALWHEGMLSCCATAAGPAFEGAQIAMGMPAAAGAICGVKHLADGQIATDIIGDVPATGICGTGIIAAIRMLLETGVLDETGMLDEDSRAFAPYITTYGDATAVLLGDTDVLLTAQDIREIQLAKAAIAAGIDTLLHAAGVAPADTGALLLAGGFGSMLNPEDAAAIGLIPGGLATRTQAMGNLALSGACMMLFSKAAQAQAEALAAQAQEVPLATNPYFMDKYVEHMLFPEGTV